MKKTLQIWSTFILILFLFPVLMNLLPDNEGTVTSKMMQEPQKIVYASNVFEEEIEQEVEQAVVQAPTGSKKVLLYFTHNQEAYEPITQAVSGKVTATHHTENITKFGEKLQTQLIANDVGAEILPVNNAEELNKQNMSFSKSYHSIRPFVQTHLAQANYDLIIDLHRDSIGRDKTTAQYEGNGYARVAFVVGLEHPNYKQNEEKMLRLKEEMENVVPGITRNVIRKGGKGVDGKYNQDIHPNLIVVELGGIENTEEELNRTVAVLAEAVQRILSE